MSFTHWVFQLRDRVPEECVCVCGGCHWPCQGGARSVTHLLVSSVTDQPNQARDKLYEANLEKFDG